MPITEIEKRKTEKILLKQSKSKENKLEWIKQNCYKPKNQHPNINSIF